MCSVQRSELTEVETRLPEERSEKMGQGSKPKQRWCSEAQGGSCMAKFREQRKGHEGPGWGVRLAMGVTAVAK